MSMYQKENRKSFPGIDLVKFLMAICVVAIHTHPLQGVANERLNILYDLTVQMAVPFFFLSSGYLLAVRFDPRDMGANIRIVQKQLRKVVKMYLVWCLIYGPFSVYYYVVHRSGISFVHILVSYARCLLCIGGHYNAYQLWYLLSTIYALIFLCWLLRRNWSSGVWLAVIGALCALSIGMDVLADYDGPLSAPMGILKLLVGYTTVDGRPLQGLFLIPAGMLMAEQKISFPKWLLVFAVSFCGGAFVEHGGAAGSVLKFLSAVALFGMTLHLKPENRPVYPMLRMISTDMYLIHLYVWILYSALVDGAKRYGFDSFAVTTVVCVAIGCVHFSRKKIPASAQHPAKVPERGEQA